MYVIKKIVCDLCNGNIINIQFISFNKEKKEIKRAFKLRKLYLVRRIVQSGKSLKVCRRFKKLPWSIPSEKMKIPLQNNGTLAYYKNILYLNFAWKPTPSWERSWVAALFLLIPKSFTSSS